LRLNCAGKERPGFCFKAVMGSAHIATVITMIFASLIPSSCTKVAPSSKAAPKTAVTNAVAVATNSNERDLGELSLTNHYETCVQLGAGKSCTIRPNVIDRKDVRDGKSFEVAIGDMNFTLTPNMVSE
jgi:hypothetical protein